MLYNILQYFLIFAICSVLGWCLELIYKRFFRKNKVLTNPGFLHSPVLPIYGFSACLFYAISDLDVNLGIKVIGYILVPTLLELFTGAFFYNYYHIRLWDYSNLRFNYKGYIALGFSLMWGVLGVVYYYLLFPYFVNVTNLLYDHLEYTFIIGMFYGLLIVDVVSSFDLVNQIKTRIEDHEKLDAINEKVTMDIRELRTNVRSYVDTYKSEHPGMFKSSFLNPIKSDMALKESITELIHEKYKK